ncbi:unnamed protein product [Tuber melanosporum]|uniref:(Perigord truffle) hypothetical protein n=1 Tax=Tuber melanosporum (strain Mel28) TaxID=656061 RepID=D5GNS8_TUBMM|nr:uncharacterized protein GSTUM_00011464001 [Tuber melanosporum]CAZ86171.1 unnamed protein product [Tuber melanosporum]
MDSTTKAIDPYGDVIVLLPTATATTKLRVSSKILSTASLVFRSMFSRRYREGAALASTTALVEIEFPDDPPQALEAVFNVLHFRHDCVSADVSHDVLYEIALVADKYDLVVALGPWKEEGFREGCRRAVMQDLGCGDDGDGENDGGKGEKGGENVWDYDVLPEKLVGLISAYRISTIKSLLSVTAQFRSLYQGPGMKCKLTRPSTAFLSNEKALICDAAILGSLIRHEAAIGIFPVPSPPYNGISVESLALSMKKLLCFVDITMGHGSCTISGQVVKMVNEVLAGVGTSDIWDSARNTDGERGQ